MPSSLSNGRDWPAWIRYTLTALAGVLTTAVTMTIAFSDVSHTARDAKARADDHETRIQRVERLVEKFGDRWDALFRRMDMQDAKLDAIQKEVRSR